MSESAPMQTVAPRSTASGSTTAYAVVLLLTTIFIVYGSLFPFAYRERGFPGGPVAYLLSTWQDWDRRGDLLSNILLYIPFGFFATYTLPSRLPGLLRAIVAAILGTALATGIELIQFHDASRVSTMGDVYANAIGTGIGALAAAVIGASMRWPFMRELAAHPTASLLLVMFFGYRFYPYVPTIDMHKYWHAVQPMILAPGLPPGDLARFAIVWLFIAVLMHSLYGFARFLLLFPLLCGFEFLGRILIIDTTLKWPDVIGAAIAYGVWALLLRRMPGRYAIVTLIFAGMVAAVRLEPFQFSATPHAFGWIPFASFMRGSTGVAMQSFCEKFYQYGGLIWLLRRSGVTLPIGTALTAALLFVTSYAECWLPGRSAEITDAAMALVIGGAFGLLRGAARSSEPQAAVSSRTAVRAQEQLAAAVLGQHGVLLPAPRRRGRKYAPYVPPHLREPR